MKLLFFDKLSSTNDYLKEVPFSPFLGVVALEQTCGRGRRGKSWLSKRGKGLYLSVMFPPLKENLTLASLAFGYGVYRVLRELSPSFYLKWPNDIYFKGKKVSGVLPENLKDRLIVGVGVNLSYTQKELSHLEVPATSLKLLGIEVELKEFAKKVYSSLVSLYKELLNGSFSPSLFERACPLIGKEVLVNERGKIYTALALGVDRDGALVVETEGEVKRLFCGEVSLREVV